MHYNDALIEIEEIIVTLDSKNVLSEVVDFLYYSFDYYNWIGIYVVKGNYLVLGPWRGPNATEHTKIPIGKGICGSAAVTKKTELIDDVNADSRYLSCFFSTKSEIVVPIKKNENVVGEIDIDSDKKNAFTNQDAAFLERIADMLSVHI